MIVTDVHHCARCGKSHDDLTFKEFDNPVEVQEDNSEEVYTHWATCPNTGDPILLRVIQEHISFDNAKEEE